MTPEQTYTATGDKLAWHWPIFRKYRETGFGSIIRATMTLHQACTSRCHYCSTINRQNADTTTLQEAQDFVTALYDDQADFNRRTFPGHNARYREACGSDIRLRGLILSGGGQPNLWPHFAEFVGWLSQKDIALGLITNGFPKRVAEEVYRHFQWIRISITPEDESPHYAFGPTESRQHRWDMQYLPATILGPAEHRANPSQTVGLSSVYGAWTADDLLARIDQHLTDGSFDYCRLLPDCNLPRAAQLQSHADLADRLARLSLTSGKIFHQSGKVHGTPAAAADLWDDGQCRLQVYTTFWDTSEHHKHGHSWLYPCDSVTVLADESSDSERRFNHEKWGTYTNREVAHLFTEPVKPFFDPRENCTACLFMRNNRRVRELTDGVEVAPSTEPMHAAFP